MHASWRRAAHPPASAVHCTPPPQAAPARPRAHRPMRVSPPPRTRPRRPVSPPSSVAGTASPNHGCATGGGSPGHTSTGRDSCAPDQRRLVLVRLPSTRPTLAEVPLAHLSCLPKRWQPPDEVHAWLVSARVAWCSKGAALAASHSLRCSRLLGHSLIARPVGIVNVIDRISRLRETGILRELVFIDGSLIQVRFADGRVGHRRTHVGFPTMPMTSEPTTSESPERQSGSSGKGAGKRRSASSRDSIPRIREAPSSSPGTSVSTSTPRGRVG